MTRRETSSDRSLGLRSEFEPVPPFARRSGGARRNAVRPPGRDLAPRLGHNPTLALRTDAFQPQSAARAWPPPAAAVQALAAAKRVVTIGHTPPDGDCVGAALGLARGLTKLGRQTHAIVDADLPAGLRGLAEHGDLHRGRPDFAPDLVVLVDVAEPDRIGAARALLPEAKAVLVVDHHRVRPTPAKLGAPNAPLSAPMTAWVDDRCDAASLQVAALLETLGAAPQGWGNEWAHVAEPLAAGIATDTQWFRSPRASTRSLAVFKALLDGDLNALEALEARLSHDLPPLATALLASRSSTTGLPKALGPGRGQAAELAVTRQARRLALAAARRVDPRTTMEDVSGHLMDQLDRLAEGHHLAVLLQEQAEGWVRVSIRSRRDDLAVRVAALLGGGGKRGVAGATVRGRLSTVQLRVRELILQHCAAHHAA